MQINGIAHTHLTVSIFDACLPFHDKLLEFFEMQCLVKTDALYQLRRRSRRSRHPQGGR